MQHHGFFRNYDLLWFADQQHKKAMFAKTQTKKNIIKCSKFKDGLCPSLFSAFLIQEKPQKMLSYLKLCRRHRRELVRFLDISRFLYSL